jgi:hypothetical protein
MRSLEGWRLGEGPAAELFRYGSEQEPPSLDIERFLAGAKIGPPPLPFQTWRYLLRDKHQTLSWLVDYIRCEVEYLRTNFVRGDKSFYIALLEHTESGDRSVAFRLSNSGMGWPMEWKISLRRVRLHGDDEHFLCAEY